jgi:large subunit ribosomal protein L3
VLQRKTAERDGYTAVQLGFSPAKESRQTKAAIGHAAKAAKGTFRLLREFRGGETLPVGATLSVADMFNQGDRVDVTGITKGRGYTGVIKRHGFGGFPAGHGTHEFFRHGGSIGNRSFPGRVFKGKRMSGRYGGDRVTTRNLTVVQVRPEENVLLVLGAVAGSRGGFVEIRPASGDGGIR